MSAHARTSGSVWVPIVTHALGAFLLVLATTAGTLAMAEDDRGLTREARTMREAARAAGVPEAQLPRETPLESRQGKARIWAARVLNRGRVV